MREDNGTKNIEDTLAEARNTSEPMVGLAYVAAPFFWDSVSPSGEVFGLEERPNLPVSDDMRGLTVSVVRGPVDPEQRDKFPQGLFGREMEGLG